jgi:ABC-type multidrug transport system fused ATPase/permease subunit
MGSVKPKRDLRRIVALFAGRRLRSVVLVVLNLAGGVTEAAFLVIVTRLAFAITDGRDRVGLIAGLRLGMGWAMVLAAVLVVLRFLLAAASARESARLTTAVTYSARVGLAEHYLAASWTVQHGDRVGRMQELITTFAQRLSELTQSVIGGVAAAFSLMALLGTAIAVDPFASLAVIAGVFVLSFALRPIRGALRRQAKRTAGSGMQLATFLGEYSQAAIDLHVFHVQPEVERLLREHVSANSRQNERLLFLKLLSPATYTALAYAALLMALWATSSVEAVELTSVGPVMLVMLRSLSYGQLLQVASTGINSAYPYLEALDAEMERLRVNRVIDTGRPIGELGAVEFRDVGFSYDDGRQVLHDLTFAVQPGEIIGVVGPSGSGKSTMVQLMLGLRSPTTGTVTAGGRDVASLSRTEWARRVTFVPQQPHLLAGSVAHNIRFLRADVSQDQIEQAARLSNLHNDVMGWHDGYEHQVGELGSHLSGGQQQRLVIARALVERPELMILDEPTSALDVESEHLVRLTLEALRGRVAVVIIAHRLSTLDICDRIMVLQDGEMKAFDSPGVLARDNEFFRNALRLSGLQGA